MLTSDKQVTVTKNKIEELRSSLSLPSNKNVALPLRKAALVQTQALIEDLSQQVHEYEQLRSLGIKGIKIESPEDFFLLPIKFRIAKHLSQEAFSRLVEVGVRQIMRYEAEGYQNIQGDTFKRILSKLPIAVGSAEIIEKKSVG